MKHSIIPIEISKNDSDRDIDLLIYKNHYALNRKMNFFLGDQIKNFMCTRCLTSFTSENMLTLQKQKCESFDITTIRTSPEPHLHWKNQFHKNPLYFRIYADFEVVNELDISSIGNKTTNFLKQNWVLNDYQAESEFKDFLQSEY